MGSNLSLQLNISNAEITAKAKTAKRWVRCSKF